MKKIIRAAAGFAACLSVICFTACSSNDPSDNMGGVATADTDKTEAASKTEADTEAKSSEAEEAVTEKYSYTPNAKVDLFTSKISAQGKAYEINAYLYWLLSKAESEYYEIEYDESKPRGFVAIDLIDNGRIVDTLDPRIGDIGQFGHVFDKNNIDKYFKVVPLEDGEVFVCNCTSIGKKSEALWHTVYVTVREGRLTLMERCFTEDEQKQLEGKRIASYIEYYNFITTDKFTTDKNRIIYDLDFETNGISTHCREGVYPPGEIPMTFDFENNTVKCEKDEYSGLVYMKFDLLDPPSLR